MSRVAINGMGRMGRAVLRVACATEGLELVGLNDLLPAGQVARRLSADTVYGRYARRVGREGADLVVGGARVRLFGEKDPSRLPWGDLGVEVVFECTGAFRDREGMSRHLAAGAKKVLLSGQAEGEGVPTVIYGVDAVEAGADLISCSSWQANCITPVVEVMERRVGIKKLALTSLRLCTDGHMDGAAGPSRSTSEMVFITGRDTGAEEINGIFREESATDRYRGVLGTSGEGADPESRQDPKASIVDLTMTRVLDGDLARIVSRYDDEWGYSCQMVRLALKVARE